MERIEDSIECNVPVKTCYNQWTQFETFPEFMEGVKEVRQIDDRRCQWTAEIGGKEKSWEAEIYRQVPDKEIAWRATSGAMNQGRVLFEPRGNSCLVRLTIEFEPEGAVENIGEALGVVKGRVSGDLRRFKEYIESRQQETGAWRGEIRGGQVEKGAATSSGRTTAAQTTTGGGLSGTGRTDDATRRRKGV
jgi:uncharacterized membrane protein